MKNCARLVIVLTCWLSMSSAALAQWQWLDKDGRSVFSDRSPPPNIPEKSILQRPGKTLIAPANRAADSTDGEAAVPAQVTGSGPKISGIDQDLAAKKKKAEAEQAAKNKAEESRVAAAKADNCKRARSAKAGLDSGVRMSRFNAKGEREIMDDAARSAEANRLQSIINADCR